MSTHRNGSRHGSRKDRLERLLANTQRELEELAGRPDEPAGEDALGNPVVRWDLRFTESGPIYSYVAIKCVNLWYVTGTNNRSSMSWDELLDFIDQEELIGDLWLVNGYVAL
jgi:hypothetical protein